MLSSCRFLIHFVFGLDCECVLDNSVNDTCDETGGQCNCKDGFSGLKCDSCAEGFFGYPMCSGKPLTSLPLLRGAYTIGQSTGKTQGQFHIEYCHVDCGVNIPIKKIKNRSNRFSLVLLTCMQSAEHACR